MIVNLAWPRAAVYGGDHWYYQWGAVVFTAVIALVGGAYYLAKHRGGSIGSGPLPIVEPGLVPEA